MNEVHTLGQLLDNAGLRAFELDRTSLEGVPRVDPWVVRR